VSEKGGAEKLMQNLAEEGRVTGSSLGVLSSSPRQGKTRKGSPVVFSDHISILRGKTQARPATSEGEGRLPKKGRGACGPQGERGRKKETPAHHVTPVMRNGI